MFSREGKAFDNDNETGIEKHALLELIVKISKSSLQI
jgi:hypothetical protein